MAIWSGSLAFGLVNVPVTLETAVRDLTPRLHELEGERTDPVEVRRICSEDGEEVPFGELVHGLEVESVCVMLTDDELESLAPRRTRTIDVESFVEPAEVDPGLLDRPYLLAPVRDEGPVRAYRLLHDVMVRTGRVALGRLVLRTREHVVLVRPRDGALSLQTMRYPDELRSVEAVGSARVGSGDLPSKKAVTEATKLLEAMRVDFDPSRYEDRHRERLERVIADKQKGRRIEAAPEPEEPEPPADLMAALRESLASAKKAA